MQKKKGSCWLISACLLGVACRYDGREAPVCLDPAPLLGAGGMVVPVCPEQLGGLPTPRAPVEIQGGDGFDVWSGHARVRDRSGRDWTDHFRKGARMVLQIARMTGAVGMIGQTASPSCSSAGIYDGRFQRRQVAGRGVCAALLQNSGFETIGPADWENLLKALGRQPSGNAVGGVS